MTLVSVLQAFNKVVMDDLQTCVYVSECVSSALMRLTYTNVDTTNTEQIQCCVNICGMTCEADCSASSCEPERKHAECFTCCVGSFHVPYGKPVH